MRNEFTAIVERDGKWFVATVHAGMGYGHTNLLIEADGDRIINLGERAPDELSNGDKKEFEQAIHDALYCSKICSYAQGFQLMREAQKEYDWKLNFGEIAKIWRGGCIIRARFLNRITEAYQSETPPTNLMLSPFFTKILNDGQQDWREVVALAATNGIPVPSFGGSLSYYDAYRAERTPANLLQAQRDFFGAHTYERTDKPEGEFFHTEDWPDLIS